MVVRRSSHSYWIHLLGILNRIVMLSNFLLIFSFSFFKSARCLVLLLSLFSFFSLSELSNFLTDSSFLRQHTCRYGLPICNDPQGEQRINPWVISWGPFGVLLLFSPYYLIFLVRMLVSGVTINFI